MGNRTGGELRPGAKVTTHDGVLLGEVAEASASRLKVRDSRASYWLNRATIDEVIGDTVVLAFDRARLGDFRLSEAEPAGGASAHPAETGGRGSGLRIEVDESQPAYLRPGSGGSGGSPD